MLDVLAALGVAVITLAEHRHSIRASSAFLGLYLFVGISLDAIQSRSYYERHITALSATHAASAVIRLLLLVVNEIPKASSITDAATSGFWSRVFFVFMGPIFWLGYRGTLRMQDLTGIGAEFSSAHLARTLTHHWKPSVAGKKAKPNSLLIASFWIWLGPLCAALIPRLFLTGFNFSQPYVLRALLGTVGPHGSDSKFDPYIVVAVLASFTGSAVCKGIATHMTYRLVMRLRGGLMAVTMDKGQRLPLSSEKKRAAISLISAEVGGIADGMPLCIEIPFIFLESGLGIYLLVRQIHASAFVIVVPLLMATVATAIVSHYSAPAMDAWNEHIQSRVSKTSRIISQLAAVKIQGLGPRVAQYVQHLRWAEVARSKTYRAIRAPAIALASYCDLLVPTVLVAAALFWTGFNGHLSPDTVFPTLALAAILQEPLAEVFTVIPTAKTMVVFFERIQEFLCQEEHKDSRTFPDETLGEKSASAGAAADSGSLVSFDSVTLAPPGTDRAVLQDVYLTIPPGSVSSMFGPTGSGKSILMQGLLGEAAVLKGEIQAQDVPVAHCGQEVWLPNVSVQDCIVGFCEYDDAWFNTVITHCQLVEDLQRLPGGKDYIVGLDGIALSGGQRLRVSIARAAFAREKLVLLDDPLSALDGTTSRALISGLLGPDGLFKQSGTAVVISSNMTECIRVADQYIVLDGKGKVTISTPDAAKPVESQLQWLFSQDKASGATSGAGKSEKEESEEEDKAAATSPSEEEEDATRKRGDLRLYSFWLGFIGYPRFARWFLLVAGAALMDGMHQIYLKFWVADAPDNKPLFIGYALVPVLCVTFLFFGLWDLYMHLSPRASLASHEQLTDSVFGTSLGYLASVDTGVTMNMYSLDMNLINKNLPGNIHNTAYFSLGVAVQFGIVLSAATYMSTLIPVILLALFYLQRFYLCTSRQLRHLELEAQAPLVTWIEDTAKGLACIRGFRWQDRNRDRNLQLLDEAQKPVFYLYCAQALLGLMLDMLSALISLVLALLTVYLKHGTSQASTGVSVVSLIVLSQGFSAIIFAWTKLETSLGSLARLKSFINRTRKEKDGNTPLPNNWPSAGKVDIDISSARHGTGVDGQERAAVLHDIKVSVDAGSKVALTGRTGSGKTSLVLALLGFLEYEGSIKIDGAEVRNAPHDELRSRIITISQDHLVLDGSIRENLLPFDTTWSSGPKDTPSEKDAAEAARKDAIVKEALEDLQIWSTLEDKGGLDAVVDKVGYSHGEIQLLCVARAVVRRRLTGSNLVLVDEGTSNVDRWRDQVVRDMMTRYFSGCTMVIIAHRDETIAGSNANVTLANGRVARYQTL